MNKIYLDNAASTPLLPEVKEFMIECIQNDLGNPSAIHQFGRQQRSKIESARSTVAGCIKASLGEVFFTSGGTESNNTVLRCAVDHLGVEHIISSPTEHPSVANTLKYLSTNRHIEVTYLNVDAQGNPDITQLEELLKAKNSKTLVSLMHGNNEMGTMIDLKEVATLCYNHGVPMHSDTVQTMGHFRFDMQEIPVSFVTGSAHKFHGPKGTGLLYCHSDYMVPSLIKGGGQERNMRAGTEGVMNIAATAMALKHMEDHLETYRTHVLEVRDYLKKGLKNRFPDISFNGNQVDQFLYTVLSVDFPASSKTDMLIPLLDIEGIAVSGSSACSSGAEQKSRVIQAIKPDSDTKTIRISFSHENTIDQMDQVLSVLEKVLA